MLTRLALGAEIDLATSDELNSVKGSLLDALNGNKDPQPHYTKLVGQEALTAGNGVIRIGQPCPAGKLWNLTAFCLMGTDAISVPGSGTTTLCVGDPSNIRTVAANQIPLPEVIYPVLNNAAYHGFTAKVVWIRPQESLYMVTVGSSFTAMTGVGFITEYNIADITQLVR